MGSKSFLKRAVEMPTAVSGKNTMPRDCQGIACKGSLLRGICLNATFCPICSCSILIWDPFLMCVCVFFPPICVTVFFCCVHIKWIAAPNLAQRLKAVLEQKALGWRPKHKHGGFPDRRHSVIKKPPWRGFYLSWWRSNYSGSQIWAFGVDLNSQTSLYGSR